MTKIRELTIKVLSDDILLLAKLARNAVTTATEGEDSIVEVSITKTEEVE